MTDYKERFIEYPNTLKLVKINSAVPRFFFLLLLLFVLFFSYDFSLFENPIKHSFSCLTYYI